MNDSDDLTRPETLIEGWSELPDSALDWAPGQHLGPFRLRRQLGQGGMGIVWLAEQTAPLRRDVAIKVLLRNGRSRLSEAYFEVERQTLAQLSHRAIAQIYDAGRLPDGGLFFAMEYVPGVPLDQFLADNPLEFRELAGLFIEICSGVQHAHQRGLIHRDIKPQNILVRVADGIPQPKIIDFGIAIGTDGGTDAGHPSSGAAYLKAGTRAYMSPEQMQPEAGGVDIRTDVYALGAVLAQSLLILAGNRSSADDEAFVSSNARDALEQSRGGGWTESTGSQATADTTSLRMLPAELRAIAATALAADRDQRYESAAAMAEDLRRWLRIEPVRALEDSRAYRMRCFLRRNALASAAVGLISLSLIVGSVLALYGLTEARQGRTQAEIAQGLAEQRRNDAEQLIEFMLGDFAAQLRPIGRLDLLDDIGAEAHRYLVGQSAGSDATSALNRARALRTLGEVQSQRQEFDLAAETLAEAAALIAPWQEDVSQEMGELHFESGQIAFWRGAVAYRQRDWDTTEAHWRRYLRDAQAFAEVSRDPQRAQWELAYAYNNLGTVAEARDQPEQALEYLQRSTELRRGLVDETDAGGVLGLANNLSWIGRVQHALGKPAETWRSAAEALDLVVAARLDAPDDARLRQAEINFRINLARLAGHVGLVEPAVAHLRRARRLAEEDVDNDPTQTRRQTQLATIAFLLARLPAVSQDEAGRAFEQGEQSLAVAVSQGLAPQQGIELPALRQLAALHLGISQETTTGVERKPLQN
ncbi:MAG: serine/threonine-protein kinase, partial [Wenzhouxiangellaceae bacterium]